MGQDARGPRRSGALAGEECVATLREDARDGVEGAADTARKGLQRRDDDDGDDRQHDGVLRHRLPALIREAREEILDLVHELHLLSSSLELSAAGPLRRQSEHRGTAAGSHSPKRGNRAGERADRAIRRRSQALPVTCAAMENLIDGKAVAAQVRAEVGERVRALQERTGVQCGLATVMVGDDPASAVYVGNKHRACHEAGMASFDIHLPGDIDQDGIHAKIDEVCADPRVHGMIVQLPLPSQLDEDAALDRILYTKDADGLTPAAQGRLATLRPGPRPATPNGVVELLRRYDV